MHRTRLLITLGVLACWLTVGCSEPPEPAKPKFKGRLLLLSGDDIAGKDLRELTAGPNDTLNLKTIAPGAFEAAANPDHTQILYATKDGISLGDLSSGEVKQIVNGENYCLAWSLDGKRFSYKQRSESRKTTLFVSDLNGKATLVWEDRLADNRTVNQGSIRTEPDTTACPQWVAPDKLIFDRFGPSQKRSPGIKPNTTTLATVGNLVKLVDADKHWSVEAVCKTGNAFLRSEEGQILIAKSLEDLKTANPSNGPCSNCRFVGFAPQSCVPFFIEENSRDSSDLFYLNPTNWQRQRSSHIGQTFSPAATMLINSSTRWMIVGDAPASLLLVDTESGDLTPLVPAGNTKLVSPIPIVWIEK